MKRLMVSSNNFVYFLLVCFVFVFFFLMGQRCLCVCKSAGCAIRWWGLIPVTFYEEKWDGKTNLTSNKKERKKGRKKGRKKERL